MPAIPWKYPVEFLDALAAAGLRPTPTTPPSLVREALDDLYRLELTRLRDRQRGGEIEKAALADHVIALRKRYWLLTLPLQAWEKICTPS